MNKRELLAKELGGLGAVKWGMSKIAPIAPAMINVQAPPPKSVFNVTQAATATATTSPILPTTPAPVTTTPAPVVTSPILTVNPPAVAPLKTAAEINAQGLTPAELEKIRQAAVDNLVKNPFKIELPNYDNPNIFKPAIAPMIDQNTNKPVVLNDPKSVVMGYNGNMYPNLTAANEEKLRVAAYETGKKAAAADVSQKEADFAAYKAATEENLAKKMQEMADKLEIDRVAMQNTMNANFISATQTARQLNTSNPYAISAVSEAQQIQEDLRRAEKNLKPKYSGDDNTILYVGGGLLLLLALIK